MIYDRPARRGPRIYSDDIVSLVIGVIVLVIEGVLMARGWLPPPWH